MENGTQCLLIFSGLYVKVWFYSWRLQGNSPGLGWLNLGNQREANKSHKQKVFNNFSVEIFQCLFNSFKMTTKQGLLFWHANLSQCLCAGIQLKFHGVIMGLTLLLNHPESSQQLIRHQHTRRLVPCLLGCWGSLSFPTFFIGTKVLMWLLCPCGLGWCQKGCDLCSFCWCTYVRGGSKWDCLQTKHGCCFQC